MTTPLLSLVIDGGYCIGCGACALGGADSGIQIKLDESGRYQARILNPSGLADEKAAAVCPFSDASVDEDRLAAEFTDAGDSDADPHLGRVIEAYAGHVSEDGFRVSGSSGGFTSWLLTELLAGDVVDAVIHVKPCLPDETDPALFRYGISRTAEELRQGAKSHYYPVELSGMLQYIRDHPGRYAVVGVPCFIKAVRLLGRQEPVFRERVAVCVGLFCGHLKSTDFAGSLAWQCGIEPGQLSAIDFRTKLPDEPASHYGITVRGRVDGREVAVTRKMSTLAGANWGMGFFKYQACDFCDDVSAETADVSVGDAWLPQFVRDGAGTNVVLIRNRKIQSLVAEGIRRGALAFSPLSLADVGKSQQANIRHRREELGYRLHVVDLAGRWRPTKRLAASDRLAPERKVIQDQRMQLRVSMPLLWKDAVAAGSLSSFLTATAPLIARYEALLKTPQKPSRRRVLKRRLKALFMSVVSVFKISGR